MLRTFVLVICLGIGCLPVYGDVFGTGPDSIEIEFVTIGNPGNASYRSRELDVGRVDYDYRIGKYEISREQVTRANQIGDLEIGMFDMGAFPAMGVGAVVGGPRPAMPAAGVTTNEAARFVNWLNESEGFPHAYKFDAQPGEANYDSNAFFQLWDPNDTGYDSTNRFRNSLAKYVIPSEDEWVKAAYYDPNMTAEICGCDVDEASSFWNLPNGTFFDAERGGGIVWREWEEGPADVMDAGDESINGLFGMLGNVWELNETTLDTQNLDPTQDQWVRGGAWSFTISFETPNFYGRHLGMPSSFDSATANTGFRVASVPEPGGWPVGLLLLATLHLRRSRRD